MSLMEAMVQGISTALMHKMEYSNGIVNLKECLFSVPLSDFKCVVKCLAVWIPDCFIYGKLCKTCSPWLGDKGLSLSLSPTYTQTETLPPPGSSLQCGPFKSSHMSYSKHVTLCAQMTHSTHMPNMWAHVLPCMYRKNTPTNGHTYAHTVDFSSHWWTLSRCRNRRELIWFIVCLRFCARGNSKILITVWELTCNCYFRAGAQTQPFCPGLNHRLSSYCKFSKSSL